MWTENLQMSKPVLEKSEEPEIKLPTSTESSKKKTTTKKESSRKISNSTLLSMQKPLTVWNKTLLKILQGWECKTTLPASWETSMQVKKKQLEPDMEQRTGSKLEKENVKAVCCHPAYLPYMQSTSYEIPGWMKHSFKSKLLGKYE